MNYRQRIKLIAGDHIAPTGRWLVAHWVNLAAVAWLGAALSLSSPGVAKLVTCAPCESDAPQENERATVDESSAPSHFRRPILRQLTVRRTFSLELVFQSPSSAGVRASQPPNTPHISPDSLLGAGRPLRC